MILELQARCGVRIGEVLNLRVSDISGRKLLIQDPRSGRDAEVAFMPEHIAARLADYTANRKLPLVGLLCFAGAAAFSGACR